MDARQSAYDRLVSGVTAETLQLLGRGAEYWSDSGPAHLDKEMAALMQLPDALAASRHLGDVKRRLDQGEPTSVLDLTRALWLAEIGISSVVVGPSDWHNVFGPSADYDAFLMGEFAVLLRAQDELLRPGVPASGTDPFGKASAA